MVKGLLIGRPTFHILHDKAQMFFSLKRGVQRHDEWVISEDQYVSLREHLIDLISQHQVRLQQLLHGESLVVKLVPDEPDGAARQGLIVSHSVRI